MFRIFKKENLEKKPSERSLKVRAISKRVQGYIGKDPYGMDPGYVLCLLSEAIMDKFEKMIKDLEDRYER